MHYYTPAVYNATEIALMIKFILTSKIKKNLCSGINLTKDVKDLCTKNYQVLMRKVKNINK